MVPTVLRSGDSDYDRVFRAIKQDPTARICRTAKWDNGIKSVISMKNRFSYRFAFDSFYLRLYAAKGS